MYNRELYEKISMRVIKLTEIINLINKINRKQSIQQTGGASPGMIAYIKTLLKPDKDLIKDNGDTLGELRNSPNEGNEKLTVEDYKLIFTNLSKAKGDRLNGLSDNEIKNILDNYYKTKKIPDEEKNMYFHQVNAIYSWIKKTDYKMNNQYDEEGQIKEIIIKEEYVLSNCGTYINIMDLSKALDKLITNNVEKEHLFAAERKRLDDLILQRRNAMEKLGIKIDEIDDTQLRLDCQSKKAEIEILETALVNLTKIAEKNTKSDERVIISKEDDENKEEKEKKKKEIEGRRAIAIEKINKSVEKNKALQEGEKKFINSFQSIKDSKYKDLKLIEEWRKKNSEKFETPAEKIAKNAIDKINELKGNKSGGGNITLLFNNKVNKLTKQINLLNQVGGLYKMQYDTNITINPEYKIPDCPTNDIPKKIDKLAEAIDKLLLSYKRRDEEYKGKIEELENLLVRYKENKLVTPCIEYIRKIQALNSEIEKITKLIITVNDKDSEIIKKFKEDKLEREGELSRLFEMSKVKEIRRKREEEEKEEKSKKIELKTKKKQEEGRRTGEEKRAEIEKQKKKEEEIRGLSLKEKGKRKDKLFGSFNKNSQSEDTKRRIQELEEKFSPERKKQSEETSRQVPPVPPGISATSDTSKNIGFILGNLDDL